MSKCPNCNYTLVLLEHRQKYKCPKCGRLFSQQKIELIEFNKFNKTERIKDKEVIEVDKNKRYKQPKLTEFQRKQNALISAKKWRDKNKESIHTRVAKYYQDNFEIISKKKLEHYLKNRERILATHARYRRENGSARRKRQQEYYRINIDAEKIRKHITYWRIRQKALAVLFFENESFKTYNDSLSSKWLTISLS